MVALKSLRPPLFVFALLLALSGSAARASAIETRATPEPRDPAPNQAAEAPPSPEGAPPVEAARVTGEPVETKADSIDFHRDTKRAVATGNVVVTYRSTRLTADKVSVDNLTKDAFAEGNVHKGYVGEDARTQLGTGSASMNLSTVSGSITISPQ